jgi:cytochrome c553
MSNRSRFLFAIVTLSGLAVLSAEGPSWLKGTGAQKLDKLADIQPGLGPVMVDYSTRAGNVYYAAQGGNWGFAAYQLKEMTEIQEVAENTRPEKAAALKAFEKSSLGPLAKDIENQDQPAFKKDFQTMITACNGCHKANGMGFVVYQLPAQPATPAKMETVLKFNRAELHKLLGDLVN